MAAQANFEEYVESRASNSWIREPGLSLYVRRSNHPRADFELANLIAKRPGAGKFTQFLDKYEPQYRFYVENVVNPRLDGYLLRRSYQVWAPAEWAGLGYPLCYVSTNCIDEGCPHRGSVHFCLP